MLELNKNYNMDCLHGLKLLDDNTIDLTLTSTDSKNINQNLRIRKLTPKECWRLMGCSDDDFDKAQTVCSNSQLYKQAGNAIVVDVFEAILRNMIQ